MWDLLIIAVIWVGFILHWGLGSIPNRKTFEIFAGVGIAICSNLVVVHLFDWFFPQTDPLFQQLLGTIGSIFYVIAIGLSAVSLLTLRSKGKPEEGIEETTILIERGIFQYIRHPLYLGLAFWGLGLVFIIQSLVPTFLGILAIISLWAAGVKEDEYNLKKFGNSYREYMDKIPMWNVFKRLRNK